MAWGKKILNLNLVELKKNDFAKKSFKNTYLYQKLSGSFKSYVLWKDFLQTCNVPISLAQHFVHFAKIISYATFLHCR